MYAWKKYEEDFIFHFKNIDNILSYVNN